MRGSSPRPRRRRPLALIQRLWRHGVLCREGESQGREAQRSVPAPHQDSKCRTVFQASVATRSPGLRPGSKEWQMNQGQNRGSKRPKEVGAAGNRALDACRAKTRAEKETPKLPHTKPHLTPSRLSASAQSCARCRISLPGEGVRAAAALRAFQHSTAHGFNTASIRTAKC